MSCWVVMGRPGMPGSRPTTLEQLPRSVEELAHEVLTLNASRAVKIDQDGVKVDDVVLESSVIEHDGLISVFHGRELLLPEEDSLVVTLPHFLQMLHN